MIAGLTPHLPLIIHSPDDEDLAFVHHQLLPALGLTRQQVNISGERRLGELILKSLEDYVLEGAILIGVISAAILRDGLSELVLEMAQRHRERGGRFVPLVFADGELPPRLGAFEHLDCTTPPARVHSFQRLREWMELAAPPPRDLPCPYRGLRPYDEAATAAFAGRDREARRLAAQLVPPHGVRELYLLGPSGAGKTSFLHAGLLPEVRRRAPDRLDLRVIRTRDLLSEAQPAPVVRPSLVAIDQLEEVFALSLEQRDLLFTRLETMRADPQLQLVYCLRSDFRGELRSSRLATSFEHAARENLKPLQGQELAEALRAPASSLSVELAPSLLRRLLKEAEDEERGSLPLLQLALTELWPHREYDLLTEDSYLELAGPHASGLAAILERQLSRAVYSLPSADDHRVALRVLLRLVQFGEGRADTRRRQPRQALGGGEPVEQLERVLAHLTGHRILQQDCDDDEPFVDLAHETLIDAWPELQRFIKRHRVAERHRRALEQRAGQWKARRVAAPHDGLLDELELQEIHQQLSPDVLSDLGTSAVLADFLRASQEHLVEDRAERERQLQRQRAQLARYLIDKAHSFLRGGRPARAFPLLLEARDLGASGTAISSLFHWARRGLPVAAHEAVAAGPLLRASPATSLLEQSRRGTYVAIARGRVLRLLDLSTEGEPRYIDASGNITGVYWAPESAHLAVTSEDRTVRLWDATSGKVDSPLLEHPSDIHRLEWRDAQSLLVTTTSTELYWRPRYPPEPSLDPAAAPPAPPALLEAPHPSLALRAVARDRNVHVISDSQSDRLDHRTPVVSLAWSPEGDRLAVACRDGSVRVWSRLDELVLLPDLSYTGITALAWSPDGSHLLAYVRDAFARCWSTPHHAPTEQEWEDARRNHAALTPLTR